MEVPFSIAYLLATLTGLVDSRNGHRLYPDVCMPQRGVELSII